MSGEASGALERSRRELAAAQLLADHGFAAQAVSRAYYAAFYAAEEALLVIGEVRSKHGGVIAAFGRELVRHRGLDPRAGQLLRSLFERRSRADYELGQVPPDEGSRAVRDAGNVVEAVAVWIDRGQR